MDNYSESSRWLKDAKDSFERAERCFNINDWRGTIQNAQLAIELSAKAIISLFEEPDWTHSPDAQLVRVIEERKDDLLSGLDKSFLDEILQIANDVKFSAPWHGWSVYGKEDEEQGIWISAVDLCSEGIAKEMFEKGRRVIKITQDFFNKVR